MTIYDIRNTILRRIALIFCVLLLPVIPIFLFIWTAIALVMNEIRDADWKENFTYLRRAIVRCWRKR